MEINLYLETAPRGKTMIHLLDFPGCIVKGITRDDALAHVQEGVFSYMCWRERHGFSFVEEPYTFVIKEEVKGGPFNPGDKAGFFQPDQLPVSEVERKLWLELMQASRQDLLQIITSLTAEQLNLYLTSPNWSIMQILRHIASAERFYITRLFAKGELPASKPARNIYQRIGNMRENCVKILSQLSPEQISKKVLSGDEYWTARKVFRRFLEHEREHTGQIIKILKHLNSIEFISDHEITNLFQGIFMS